MVAIRIQRVSSLASSLLLAASAIAGGSQSGGPVLKPDGAEDLGLATGTWSAATNGLDGAMRGELRDESGELKFVIDAKLTFEGRDLSGRRYGSISGGVVPVATSLVPQKQQAAMRLAGRWSQADHARGEFDAFVLSELASPLLPPIAIAVLHGRLSALDPVVVPDTTDRALALNPVRTGQKAAAEPKLLSGFSVKGSAVDERSLGGQTARGPGEVIICRNGQGFETHGERTRHRGARTASEQDVDAPAISGARVDGREARSARTLFGQDDGMIICRHEDSAVIHQRRVESRDLRSATGVVPPKAEPKGIFLARWNLLF